MTANPFSFGNPVSDPSRFFGREREIRQITDRLQSSAFESTSVVGERRIGKTSLLKHLANPEVAEELGLSLDDYVVVYVDFQGCNTITPVRFWSRILKRVARGLKDDELTAMAKELGGKENIDQFDLEDLFLELDDRGLKLVLLMDEFEYVTKNENFGLDFFAGLRALAIHYPLAVITATREALVDLCHSESIKGSPFFNIFASVILRPFDREDSMALIEGIMAESPVDFTDAIKDEIYRLAGGHPIFLQMAGYFYFEGLQMGLEGDDLQTHVEKSFLGQAEPHFMYQWEYLNNHERITLLTLLTLKSEGNGTPAVADLKQAYKQADYILPDLIKRGLVIEEEDGISLFSSLFGEWMILEVGAVYDQEPTPDAVKEWLEGNQSLDSSTTEKVKSALPRIKKDYWPLIGEFAAEVAPKVAEQLLFEITQMDPNQRGFEVFISYSTKDSAVAEAVVAAIEGQNISCWYAPRNIAPGSDWADSISKAIQECSMMVLVFSEKANSSQRVMDEINYAIDQGKAILPFRIEPYIPTGSLSLHLSSRHWLEAYEPGWEAHLDQLAESVAAHLGNPEGPIQISGE